MKKLNRVRRKADSPAQAAQCKKPGTNTALTIENEIASAETGYTEEQRLYRIGNGYVLVTEFTEVLYNGSWIRAHQWRLKKNPSLPSLETRTFKPFGLLPQERLRSREISRKITRKQAMRWLDKHIFGNAIPREFQKDFCPLSLRKLNATYGRLKQTVRRLERQAKREPKSVEQNRTEIDYRSLLCALLGLDAKASGKQIHRAICAFAK